MLSHGFFLPRQKQILLNVGEYMNSLILEKVEAGIQTITLNRPDKKNAITLDMYQSLTQALKRAKDDDAIKVSVITGAGNDFSAGNDLSEFVQLAQTPDKLNITFDFLNSISTHPKPVIAAVEGMAVGIGVTMLLHCDLVVASESCKFILPFAKLGLVPEAASSYLIPNLVGHQKAFELLVLGEAFDVTLAENFGLINSACDKGEAFEFAQAYARKVSALPSQAVQLSKQLLKQSESDNTQLALAKESRIFKERLQSQEAREAFMAFLSKG